MRKQLSFALLAPLLSLLPGCLSDGQLGDSGKVRFSQIVDFVETSDFTTPIAVDAGVLLALQHPNTGGLVDPDTFAELRLRIEDDGSPGVESDKGVVFPLGFAQFGVSLSAAGKYRLVALDGDDELDKLDVEAANIGGVRLSDTAYVTATSPDPNGGTCLSSDSITLPTGPAQLHRNETLEVFVVPETTSGDPMLGMLALTVAASSDELHFDSPLVGQAVFANALRLSASGSALSGDVVDVTIPEGLTGEDVVLAVQTVDSEVDACN
jgi:hypothetical protein